MKGFLTALLVFALTGMVYAQQSQSDFSPRPSTQRDVLAPRSSATARSGFAPQSNASPRTNQTRLAALSNDSRADSIDNESDKYVIMDDSVDFTREAAPQRPFFGPENNPRIRNALQEQQRYTAQSSERSATSVLPPRNNRTQSTRGTRNDVDETSNVRYVSTQSRPVSSIYDLQITPAYEDELKQRGYLHAVLNADQARSDQIRLFGDSQRARSGGNESKIFSSQISTYQGNLVIDIDDYALQRIEEGSYTLDDFDRHNVRGVVLRYVSANNDKVDLAPLDLGQTDTRSNSTTNYNRRDFDRRDSNSRDFNRRDSNSRDYNGRDLAGDRPPVRRSNSRPDYRDRERDGQWVLPNSNRGDQQDRLRDLGSDRTADAHDRRYETSSIRRSYQDRMNDIYRDNTVRTRDRLVDRRYDDVTFSDRRDTDRRTTDVPRRDVMDDSRRELDEGFAELTQWQRELARKTREIEDQRRRLERLEVTPDAYTARYQTANNQANQARQYRPVDLQRVRDLRSPVLTDRYADSRNSNPNAYPSPYLDSYATTPPVGDPLDPKFATYAKDHVDQVTRLHQKFAAMKQANELAALENKVDNEYQQQQLKRAQAKLKHSDSTVKTFIDDGEVRNTLGGNMAAGRGGFAVDRYAANVGTHYSNDAGVADMSMRSGRQGFNNSSSQQTVAVGASDKLVRALWFIALLSIGMNMYLALLARSFYSRYNELADELRETFTASI